MLEPLENPSKLVGLDDLYKLVKPHLPNIELRQVRTPHIDKLLRDVDGVVKDVKTKDSKAPVPVVKIVRDKLAEHLKRNSGDGYIFHGETAEPLRFENLSRRDIIPVLEKNGIEWHGWHAFRRGLATQLQGVGCPDSIADAFTRHTPEGKDTRRKFYVKTGDPQVMKTSREWLQKVEARYVQIRKRRG